MRDDFSYGTVFAVIYVVFGIPLACFADVWKRRSLISLGLMVWTGLSALTGLARSFSVPALFRVGVDIGQATTSPAAYSMLSDYYSPRVRGKDEATRLDRARDLGETVQEI